MSFRTKAARHDGGADDRLPVMAWDVDSAVIRSVTATSAQTAVLSEGLYRVTSTTACWIAINDDPTASAGTGSAYLPANVIEYIYINTDGVDKIAAIRASADGTLSLTPAKSGS